MASLKHAHSYERSKANKEVYRCIHPKCSHFTQREFIVGKEVTCTKCHQLTLGRQDQLHAGRKTAGVRFLTCVMCSNSKKKILLDNYNNILDDLLKDVG